MSTSKDTKNRLYWTNMAHRYFEGETDNAEEEKLARFLTTDEANTPEFDEIKAVMGYFAAGRRQFRTAQRAATTLNPARLRTAGIYALAACLTGTVFLVRHHNNGAETDREVCVAYIEGNRCTDPDVVMKELRRTMHNVQSDDVSVTVEQQLTDIFHMLDE